jgi:hypothetical protein
MIEEEKKVYIDKKKKNDNWFLKAGPMRNMLKKLMKKKRS